MPKKKAGNSNTEQFSVTLPTQAIGMLEQLVPLGLHGNSRGEVARTLILSRLEQLVSASIIAIEK